MALLDGRSVTYTSKSSLHCPKKAVGMSTCSVVQSVKGVWRSEGTWLYGPDRQAEVVVLCFVSLALMK